MSILYGAEINHWQAYCDYTVSETATSYTVKVNGAGFHNVGWGFNIQYNAISTAVSLTGQSGISGSGNVYCVWSDDCYASFCSGSWTIQKTTASQALTLGVSTVNASGYMDGTSSGVVNITVPALASYAVQYNANGGSGAPGSQTKWYGQALTLSSSKPTRSGYTFLGWATTSGATSASYQPGASYTANAALTLYAVWKLDYAAPTISGLSAYRCTSSGAAADQGTYIRVSCSWKANNGSNATRVLVQYKASTSSSWTSGSDTAPSATSGSVAVTVGGGSVATGSKYDVRVTVYDSGGSSYAETQVGTAYYILDFGRSGHSIGFGMYASDDADGVQFGFEPSQVAVGGRSLFDAMSVTRRASFGNNSSDTTNAWFRVAVRKETAAAPNTDRCLVLLVTQSYAGTMSMGILKASVRYGSTGAVSTARLAWQYLDDPYGRVLPGRWVLAYSSSTAPTVELWCNEPSTWYVWNAVVLEDSSRVSGTWNWTVEDDYSGASAPTSGYTQLASSLYEVRDLSYGFHLYKRGQTVTLTSENQSVTVPAATSSAWGSLSLGTLPVGWRPPVWVTFNAIFAVCGTSKLLYVEAYPDGIVRIVNPSNEAYTGVLPVSATWLAGA